MHRYDPSRRRLAYGIALLAGFIDASGFLAAGGYFISFMSGNTTRLGVDLASLAADAVVPVLLIAGFVAGVTAGAVAAERAGRWRKTAVLALSGALVALAAIGHGSGSRFLFLGGSVTAMGAINNTFRRDGEVAVGVTYMTGALVRLGQGLAARLLGRSFEGAIASLLLWASLASGAVAGAVTASASPAGAAGAAVAGSLVLLAAAWRIERVAA